MAELKVEVKKVIDAPIARVFKAWVEPAQMKQWYSPEGMTTPEADVEPRRGGSYHVTMCMGDNEFKVGGEYLEYDEPHKLVFTWVDPSSIVTVLFREINDNSTEVTLTHHGFKDQAARNEHDDGWGGTMRKLAKYIGH